MTPSPPRTQSPGTAQSCSTFTLTFSDHLQLYTSVPVLLGLLWPILTMWQPGWSWKSYSAQTSRGALKHVQACVICRKLNAQGVVFVCLRDKTSLKAIYFIYRHRFSWANQILGCTFGRTRIYRTLNKWTITLKGTFLYFNEIQTKKKKHSYKNK